MVRHGLPAGRPDSAVAEHLEVLHAAPRRRVLVMQRGNQTRAVDGQLRNPGNDLGRLDLQQLQKCRDQVDCVAELAPKRAGSTQSRGPVDDQRVAHSAAVRVLLVPLERGVPGLRPAPGDVGVAVRSTDVVQARHGGVDVLGYAIEPAHLVEHAGRATLLACAVVGHDDEQRVV